MTRDSQVGYRRPPKHSQFRKGQSGNPRGRSKSYKSSNKELEQELSKKIVVHENGITRKITKRRAVFVSLTNQAMKGNTHAIRMAADMSAANQEEAFDETAANLAAMEKDIFLRFAPDLLAKLKKERKK